MKFFSNFFNHDIEKLEKQAKDVFELPNNLKAYRLDNKNILVLDNSKKTVARLKDTFPSNPIRATLELIKKLKLNNSEISTNKKSDVWTCGFRNKEARWVWYLNSEPKMTVDYEEAFKQGELEDKVYFFSARYGADVIDNIKKDGMKKVSKDINALILENSYVKLKCAHCNHEENYTIDDLVDENKNLCYASKFVLCQNCNELVRLI